MAALTMEKQQMTTRREEESKVDMDSKTDSMLIRDSAQVVGTTNLYQDGQILKVKSTADIHDVRS